MKKLAGKNAIVTGGSDGIGFAIAQAFAAHGADLILIARNEAKLAKAAAALSGRGGNIQVVSADLSTLDGVEAIAAQIGSTWNQLDVLVNNAGVSQFTPFAEVKVTEFEHQFNLNFKAPYVLTQRLLPLLEVASGSVINISSYFAQKMIAGLPSTVYSATKGAMNAWTKALAYELGPRGIRVNAIAPGTVETPLIQASTAHLSDTEQRHIAEYCQSLYPLGRLGKPEDLAGMAVYLASQESSWVTGAVFNIDGGLTTT